MNMYWGSYSFRLCVPKSAIKSSPESYECFAQHVLTREDGKGDSYVFGGNDKPGWYSLRVVLPVGIVCERCVLQWHWKSNSTKEVILIVTQKRTPLSKNKIHKR